MKKLLTAIGICILLVSMPATTAISLQKVKNFKNQLPSVNEPILTIDTPPHWARGNFTGVWGVNILGQPLPPTGWVVGYYSDMGFGRFVGVFAEFNETDATGYIGGVILGPFMLGVVGNITSGEETVFVGLGGHNETSSEFYFRIMGIISFTFYMSGTYSEFQK